MKRPLRTGRFVLWGVIAVLALSSIALLVFRADPPDTPRSEPERVPVTVLEIKPRRVEDRIQLPGRVEALDDVTVAAEQAGRVVALEVGEGDRVRAGDVLLRIDDRLWEASERQAAIRVRDAARDLERAAELRREGAISRRELETAETAAESARIALDEVRVQRSRCAPAAPVDGMIDRVFVSDGDYVSPGRPLARVLNLRQVKVIFDLPERDVFHLETGSACPVRFDALPGQVFTGRVQHVSHAADPHNNAFRVELRADNPQARIRAGLIARVGVLRKTVEDAVVLPLQAVVPMEGETVVFVAEDGFAIRRIVRIGSIQDSEALIRHGVRPGERVILDGNRNVLDGTPVEVLK